MQRHTLTIIFLILWSSLPLPQEKHFKADTLWQLKNYKTKEGFVIGIWPHETRIADAGEIRKLSGLFGFSHIFLNLNYAAEKFKMFNESGFPPGRVMVGMHPDIFESRIISFPGAYAYYQDEPNERNFPIDGMKEMIDKYSPGSLFIISGYRRTNPFTKLVQRADRVMFSSYKHWWHCFPGIWCPVPVDYDQRSDWTDMKERYEEKSLSNWVGAHRDTLDYNQLLEHATKLKLEGVWLYQLEDPVNSEKNLYLFSEAAWSAGFMQKFERKYIYRYSCSERVASDCKWILEKIEAADDIREAY